MRSKIFFNIFFVLLLTLSSNIDGREMSIKQLEERKQSDSERKKERQKRAKKEFWMVFIFKKIDGLQSK